MGTRRHLWEHSVLHMTVRDRQSLRPFRWLLEPFRALLVLVAALGVLGLGTGCDFDECFKRRTRTETVKVLG